MEKASKIKVKSTSLENIYLVEFNRCRGDNIKNVIRRLHRKGYEASLIRHKTTVLIKRPLGSRFSDFKDDLLELVQPRIGSLIMSSTSGKFWMLDNKGNFPGIFQKISAKDL